MFEALIVSTGSAGLRPLGTAAQRSWDLIVDTVRARLGPDCAALFAEPVATPQGDRIDWYAPRAGQVLALADLDPSESAAVRTDLIGKIEAIRTEATRLSESADTDSQRLGEALANALEVPSEDCVHAIRGEDGQLYPVLVNWAWLKADATAARGVLSGMTRRVAFQSAAPMASNLAGPQPDGSIPSTAPVAAHRSIFWLLLGIGWALLAAMIGLILWLSIAPCGLSPLVTTRFCPMPVTASVVPLAPERAVIEDHVAALERRLAQAEASCLPAAPLPATEPEITPQQDAELDRRLDQSGAQTGELSFTLVWDGPDDLDLAVTCPMGQTISYSRKSACGGQLDVDANVSTSQSDPVENIYFSASAPGEYRIQVVFFRSRSQATSREFSVYVRQPGQPDQVLRGTAARGRPWQHTVTIGR